MGKRNHSSPAGFTIIEMMIVMVIAAVILLIVFLAVPALQRNYRNLQRKNAVAFITAEMGRYYGDHGEYPLTATQDHTAEFLDSLKGSVVDRFSVRYAPNGESHKYPFNLANPELKLDEISIQPTHICNRAVGLGPGDTDYPIKSSDTGDTDYSQFVVWTQLEMAPVVCLDSRN